MTLHERLDRGARFDAEYRAGLSNHLPMALVALHRLGASEQRLDAFAERYAQRLADAPQARAWPADRPWRDGLGARQAWPALRHRFDQLVARDGADAVLREALPVLIARLRGGRVPRADSHRLRRHQWASRRARRRLGVLGLPLAAAGGSGGSRRGC